MTAASSRRSALVTLVFGAWVAAGCTPQSQDASPAETPPPQESPSAGSQAVPSAPAPSAAQEPQAPPEPEVPPTEHEHESEAQEPEAPAESPTPPAPEIIELEVPSGTILELELLTALDSAINRAGDEIQARTVSPLYVEGKQVLAEGAYVEGRVGEAKASGRVKGRARLAFTFDRLRTKAGTETIRTSYVEQEAESGKKKDAAVIGGAAGVGAIVGGIIGGKKGAAIGASVGGAGGTGVVLSTKGQEIRLPVGSRINVRLDEPVTIQLNLN